VNPEHNAKTISAKAGSFAMFSPARAVLCAALTLFAFTALLPSAASAKQARLFAGTFGAASNPAPFPANPYPLVSGEAIAVDQTNSDVYVSDRFANRVEKFDSAGNFLFMLGKEVNKTAVEAARPEAEQNVCPAAAHHADVCQAGKEGSTPGAFEKPVFLALDNSSGPSKGDLYVGNKGIREDEQQTATVNATGGTFTLSFEGQTTVPIAYNAPVLEVEGPGSVQAALDALSNTKRSIAFAGSSPGAYKFTFQGGFTGLNVPQMTADSSGLSGGTATATVATTAQGFNTARVEKFNSSGQLISGWGEDGQLDGSAVISPPAPVSGPFVELDGIAVGPSGNLWVNNSQNVFEFTQDGKLITGWPTGGNELAVDSEENAYFTTGQAVKFNSTGEKIGQVAPSYTEVEEAHFEISVFNVRGIALDTSTNDLYLGGTEGLSGQQRNIIKRYDSSCHPVVSNEDGPQPGCTPVETIGAGLFSQIPEQLAVDPATHTLYVANDENVIVFSFLTVPDAVTTKPTNPTHTSATLTGLINPSGIGLNSGLKGCRFEWGETEAPYEHTEVPCDKSAVEIGSGNTPVEVHAAISGLEAGKTYHYRLVTSNHNDVNEFIDQPSFGTDLAFGPPLIESASSLEVAATTTIVQARVNPRDLDTRVRIEYGTEAGVYGQSSPEIDIGSAGTGQLITPHLQGLMPATTYHYRVRAENVLAEGAEAVIGSDLTFTTQGAGAPTLPDSRRWELVSPPNKLGASLYPIAFAKAIQASASGDAVTYVANAATEPNPPGNSNLKTQVLSARGPAGWASRDIATPHDAASGLAAGLGPEVRFLSADLSRALVQPVGTFTPSLSAEASEQTPFLRTNYLGGDPSSFCAASCYRPLVSGAEGFANVPAGTRFGGETTPVEAVTCKPVCGPTFSGANPDASHVLLQSEVALVEGAPAGSLYEWSAGTLQLISVLPGAAGPAPAGGVFVADGTRNAISTDGSRVVWSEAAGKKHLYLRDSAREETIQLDAVKGGTGKGNINPVFQAASTDDSVIFFTDAQRLTPGPGGTIEGPDLYECAVVEGEGGELECELTDLTPESAGESGDVLGVPGASEDGSYVYFVANGVLPGTEGNGEHETAAAGSCKKVGGNPQATCNLYLRHGGTTSFIAALSNADSPDWIRQGSLKFSADVSPLTARVSPNGHWFAFMSQRSLTSYDNRDVTSGASDQEVFLYDSAPPPGQAALRCASCNPSGGRPHGTPYSQMGGGDGGLALSSLGDFNEQTIAASVPGWTTRSYQSRYLSDPGRLFFNSSDALSPKDSNGTGDVYEYEPPGVGDCSTASPIYSSSSGGCVSLITSGTSKEESAFLDASESGDDVFFLTQAQLSKRDIDTALDVYDARVDGGEPEPIEPVICEGDGCQLPAVPPSDPTPGSLTFHGAGNVKEPAKAKKRHAKKHKKKAHKAHKRTATDKHGGAK
jgi:hypothetical protein